MTASSSHSILLWGVPATLFRRSPSHSDHPSGLEQNPTIVGATELKKLMLKGLVLWMSPTDFQPPGFMNLTGGKLCASAGRPHGNYQTSGWYGVEYTLCQGAFFFYGFPLLIDHLSPTLAILAVSDARRGPASAFGSKEVPCGKRGGPVLGHSRRWAVGTGPSAPHIMPTLLVASVQAPSLATLRRATPSR